MSAVLLAAGESRRMGRPKQLLPLGGKTFVESCVDNLLASDIAELVVVIGHRDLDVRRAIGGRTVNLVYNADYPRGGMGTSVQRGVEALSIGSQATLIALVDQPRVPFTVIDLLIEAYRRKRSLIVIPTYRGEKGHPALVDLRLKSEILTVAPESGLNKVLRAHIDETQFVEVDDESILDDFDFPEDYDRLSNRGV